MRLSAATNSTLLGIPDGSSGTRATLKQMARLVREYRTNPTIRTCAGDLVQFLPGMSYRQEVENIFNFVAGNVRYLQDVNGIDTLQAPDVTLQLRRGDCDDQVMILCALLESIGHPTRFVAVGYTQAGIYEHVFCETRIGNEWVALDTTVPGASVGWRPEPPCTDDYIACRMVHFV